MFISLLKRIAGSWIVMQPYRAQAGGSLVTDKATSARLQIINMYIHLCYKTTLTKKLVKTHTQAPFSNHSNNKTKRKTKWENVQCPIYMNIYIFIHFFHITIKLSKIHLCKYITLSLGILCTTNHTRQEKELALSLPNIDSIPTS